MVISVKHAFQSAKGDPADTTLVRPSNWNAEHALTLAADVLVGAIVAGAAVEVPCTPAGRALIAAATAAAQRVALELAVVANTGAYVDLSGKPTLGTAAALDVGTAGNKVVQLDATAKLPAVDASQLTNVAPKYVHVREKYVAGTAGPALVSGVDTPRTLNAAVANTVPGATVASNQITLPAGEYRAHGFQLFSSSGLAKCHLYDVTNAAALIYGSPVATAATSNFVSHIQGFFTLAAPATIEFRYRGAGGTGGVAGGVGDEIFADLVIERRQ